MAAEALRMTESLVRIEQSLRAAGRLGRELISLPGFELFLSPGQLDHLSFAAPVWPGVEDWAAPVATLKAAFAGRGKRPRLEFVAELHPQLAAALEAAGLRCEMRAPLMTLALPALAPAPHPAPAGHIAALDGADERQLRAFLRRQSVAFGGNGGDDALGWLPGLRAGLQSGSMMGAVLQGEHGLAAGAVLIIGAGVGELAGVWAAPEQRRQGLAFAVCRRLLAEYAAAGYDFCWLSAAEGAQRLYEKLGFVRAGTQFNFGAALP